MRRWVVVVWSFLGGAIVAMLVAWLWPRHAPPSAGSSSVLAIARATMPMAAASSAGTAAVTDLAGGGAPDEVDLCAGRRFKINADGSADAEAFERLISLPEARSGLYAALRADPDDFARAAALRLDPAQDGLEALARMASTSNDPRVYALALGACGPLLSRDAGDAGGTSTGGGGAVTAPSCQLLNNAQWARLDPGNAAPWLAILDEASVRRDAAAQSEALYRITQSTRADERFLALTNTVLAHLPNDDVALPATLSLTVEAAGADAAQTRPGLSALSKACEATTLVDANRRQACAVAAELLFSKSDALIMRMIGAGIGTRLGWAGEPRLQILGEMTAYTASLIQPDASQPRSACQDMRHELDAFRERARLGEAGAVRAWVERSGLKPEDFVRIERETRAQASAAAASAASAPTTSTAAASSVGS